MNLRTFSSWITLTLPFALASILGLFWFIQTIPGTRPETPPPPESNKIPQPHLAQLPWQRSVDQPAPAIILLARLPWLRTINDPTPSWQRTAPIPWFNDLQNRPLRAAVPMALLPTDWAEQVKD